MGFARPNLIKMNKKENLVVDVKFVLDECIRLASIASTDLNKLPREDSLYTLPYPSGIGHLICGEAAAERINALAKNAMQRAGLARRIELSTIRHPLERLIVSRFLVEKRSLDVQQLDRALSAAIKEVKLKLTTTTHLVPCHLISARDPERIVIGPVTFHNRSSIRTLLLRKAREIGRGDGSERSLLHRKLQAAALRYYRNFQWVAEVKIAACDAATSAIVAKDAVTAALDCLHIIFGFNHTEKMRVGGAAIRFDRRAHLQISAVRMVEPSLASTGFGHIEYMDGWSNALEGDDFRFWMELCGTVLEAAVDPDLERPLSRRFLDAAQWFGEACRDSSASTRTIKFMTAMERLLTTGEERDVSLIMAKRTADLCFYPGDSREHWRKKAARAYTYRSNLVHGSMSPRDPDVSNGAVIAADVAQTVLRRAIQSFGITELCSADMTEKRLAKWFDNVHTWADHYESSSTP